MNQKRISDGQSVDWETWMCRTCGARFALGSHPPRGQGYCGPRCERLHDACTVEAILSRDLEMCHLCDRYVELKDATRDYLLPKSHGGLISPENIALAHAWCNNERGNQPLAA